MFKSAIVAAFYALLLAEASLAVVVKRDCRALHQDHDYPNGDVPYECIPAGQAPTEAGSSSVSSSATSGSVTSSASESRTDLPTGTFSALATSTASEASDSETRTTTSARPVATLPSGPKQPLPTDDNEYLGRFYQIRPAANDTMCLSACVSWDNTIGQADTINLQPCDCDKPEVQNKWTFDLDQDKTRIMIGKPKSANDTTWCIDGTTIPTNDDHPHLWQCAPDKVEKHDNEVEHQAAQDFYDVQHWNFDQKSGEISINYREDQKFCLDVENGHMDGRPIQIWECSGGPNQQWHVTPVDYQ
ncbi:hypothetical protein NCC49_005141 [Naganishia albida]|nr:hypothetical protein NCC49_005141 [Naganishia albida]